MMIASLSILSLCGCSQKQESPFLAFSVYDQKSARMTALINDVLGEAEAAGFSVEWRCSDRSVKQQALDIQELTAMSPEYLAVTPMQVLGLGEALEEAKEAGIKIILLDGTVSDLEEDVVLSVIRPDAQWEGEECAKLLKVFFGEQEAGILEVQGLAGNSQAQLRSNGFRNQLCQYDNLNLAGVVQGDYTRITAGSNIEVFMEKTGEVDGVFAHSDEEGLGALMALDTLEAEECPIVSINGQQDAKLALLAGSYLGSLESTPYLGESLMNVIQADQAGEEVERELLLRGNMYTQENAEQMQGY